MSIKRTALHSTTALRKKTAQKKRTAPRTTKLDQADPAFWDLRLYVAGQTPKSRTALANLKQICAEHLASRFRIEVIDLLLQPKLCKGDQILAIPTLVRRLPKPIRKIIGDLSDTERVLIGLDLICSSDEK